MFCCCVLSFQRFRFVQETGSLYTTHLTDWRLRTLITGLLFAPSERFNNSPPVTTLAIRFGCSFSYSTAPASYCRPSPLSWGRFDANSLFGLLKSKGANERAPLVRCVRAVVKFWCTVLLPQAAYHVKCYWHYCTDRLKKTVALPTVCYRTT